MDREQAYIANAATYVGDGHTLAKVTDAMDSSQSAGGRIAIHPFNVRIFHWFNAAAIVMLIMCGWRI